jgi:vancomycin resistance protein VanJ
MRLVRRLDTFAVVSLFVLGYVLFVLTWELLRRTGVAHWWPFALSDLFGVWLYLPWPLLALLVCLRRAWLVVALLVLPLLPLAAEYGPLVLPTQAPDQGTTVRVMTANLLGTNADTAGLGAVLAGRGADVVAVQELSETQAAALAEQLREAYPYEVLYPRQDLLGMGVFSRYPVRTAVPPQMLSGHCYCQEIGIEVAGRLVTVLNVHTQPIPDLGFTYLGDIPRLGRLPLVARVPVPTGFDTRAQAPSLEALMQRADAAPRPLLVVGDLNVSDRQPYYREFRQRLHDASRAAGGGLDYTYPSGQYGRFALVPLIRIDYVLHDDAWTARNAWTVYLPGSDHRAVVADLVLR